MILNWRPTEIMTDSSLLCSSLLGCLGFDLLVCLAVIISVTKEGVKFSTGGDIGNANIVCRQNTSVDKVNGGISLLLNSLPGRNPQTNDVSNLVLTCRLISFCRKKRRQWWRCKNQ